MAKKPGNGLIYVVPDRCDFCGTCVAVCPVDCIELAESRVTVDNEICTLCLNCVHVCPVEALAFRESGSPCCEASPPDSLRNRLEIAAGRM